MARINTNISALTAQRNLNSAYQSLNQTMSHLSTGLRINRGKDDPAGLIVSERLRTEIAAAGQAVSNTQRAKLIVSTAEGALDEVSSLLKDIQAKVVEAANQGAFSDDEVQANQLQIDSAIDSITRIANTTSFAGRKLLDGSLQYETSGMDLGLITGARIHAAQFGASDAISVNVNVDTPASQAVLAFPFSALHNSGNVTIEVRGNKGVTTLTFASNATASSIANAIKAVADATGVSARVSTTATKGFAINSRGYGSDQLVSVRILTQGQNFGAVTPSAPVSDKGADAVATINGSLAEARGNHLTMKNSSIDLELDVLAGSSVNSSFYITGGGALFQVGPQVNTNMQVNMAINSIQASQLGNAVTGFLSQVKTGGEYALKNGDSAKAQASDIVAAAIDDISKMRGRMGSFERNTLDTNMNQLNVTVENLTSAESSIRDADFAAETSKLARDQILVNAGTTILTLANQTTQSVLRLLGG
jgi:flagellin